MPLSLLLSLLSAALALNGHDSGVAAADPSASEPACGLGQSPCWTDEEAVADHDAAVALQLSSPRRAPLELSEEPPDNCAPPNVDITELVFNLTGYDQASFPEHRTPEVVNVGLLANPIAKEPEAFAVCEAVRSEKTLRYRLLPKGTLLYKALRNADSLTKYIEQNVFSTFAGVTSWYGTKEVADSYAASPWGREQGYQVVEFQTTRDLRLLMLDVAENAKYVLDALEDDIQWFGGQSATISQQSDPASTEKAQEYNRQKVDQRLLYAKVLKLAWGWDASYDEQLQYLAQLGSAITNDYAYHADEEIQKRVGDAPPASFYHIRAKRPRKPLVLNTTFAQWGWEKEQLNRISFTTDLDKALCEAIKLYTNVDGYIAPDMPSLFHRDGRLVSEMALWDSRSAVIVAQVFPKPPASGGARTSGTAVSPHMNMANDDMALRR